MLKRFAGSRDIARRITNGGQCHLLVVGDSILAGLGGAFDKGWNPPKRTGFIGGNTGSPNIAGHWGSSNGGTGPAYASVTGLAPAPSTTGQLCADRYTFNGGTTPDDGSAGGLAGQFHRGTITDLKQEVQNYRLKVLTDAMIRGVDVTVKAHVFKESTGYDNAIYLNYSTQNVARKPSSSFPFITCSGNGVIDNSIIIPHTEYAGMALTNGYIGVGFGLPNSTVTTNNKTILLDSIFWHWTSGEVGFEVGDAAVGGTTATHWAATNGVYPDLQLNAICRDRGITDFYIGLGANGGYADLSSKLDSVVARLRGFVPNAGIILASTWSLNGSTWQDPTSDLYLINQLCHDWAIADGNALFVNIYDNYGPSEFNFAGGTNEATSVGPYADSLYATNAGLTDGTHPTHNGFSTFRYGDLSWGIIMEAAANNSTLVYPF